jgi:hypothetical protein
MLALEAAAIGAVLMAEGRARRLACRPRLARLASAINRRPVTILAWHQPIALAPAVLATLVLPGFAVPGLTAAPTSASWLAARLVWMIPLAGLLLVACRQPRRPAPFAVGSAPGGR